MNRHSSGPAPLDSRPASHNIEWRAVTSLPEAAGPVTVHQDGKLAVKLGDELEFLEPPAGRDIDVQLVTDLRRMLANAGYDPR